MRILPHTMNWNNVNFLLTYRPFCFVVLSRLTLSHFKFIFLHPILTFFTQFRLSEMFGVNWQVLAQWAFWKFCKYIIRSEIIYRRDFKVERTRRVSSIWNQKYDFRLKFHDTKFNHHMMTSLTYFAFHLIAYFKQLENLIGYFVFVWISFNFTCLFSPKFGILQMHKLWLNII